ncbi:exported hypothetical protein [uncultured Mycobacterium sp.]|uniref:Uncharacterized protein n=1 Tax=uncultured Mycobacterium sp. TaxID=171292 RepID=A0A1Y5PL77_9MYCO|nr:exported hypothetical protein [uncultured Mycobacterium sp.]
MGNFGVFVPVFTDVMLAASAAASDMFTLCLRQAVPIAWCHSADHYFGASRRIYQRPGINRSA